MESAMVPRLPAAAAEPDQLQPAFSDLFHFNVGGWAFSIPSVALSRFRESVLWQTVCGFSANDGRRIFLDRDGFVFGHIHRFLLAARLSLPVLSDLEVLYEQMKELGLQPMIEAVEKLKDEEFHLCQQTEPDLSVPEKASISYWKTPKWSSRLSELPVKGSRCSGHQDKAPLGLLDNPFLNIQEDVPFCFLPMDMLEKYPGLLTDENLLWFSENFALIECGCWEFRFIGNFLHTGKFFLPEKFSKFNVLEAEIKSLGIPRLLQALRGEKKSSGHAYDSNPVTTQVSRNNMAGSKGELYITTKPFYILALDLLAKYPDSALGQLSIESSVDGSKLYIIGNGTLFLHVKNWLGMCRLPLARGSLEIYSLCTYLDRGDPIYQPMRDAVRSYLKSRSSVDGGTLRDNWRADVRAFPHHQIVRVYVRSHWYATYLKTLLEYPELLQNSRKVCWITCGFSLLVNADGETFRHILNFLRLGSLHLPSGFTEWSLLCQEVDEFQIPSLVKALYECEAYRLWVKDRVHGDPSEDPKPEVRSWISSRELRDEDRPQDERNVYESNPKIGACAERPTRPPPHNASDERNTLKQHIGDRGCLCHHVTGKRSGCGEKMLQDRPTVTGVAQAFISVYDAIRRQSSPMQENLLLHQDYKIASQTVTQCSYPTLDGATVSSEGTPGPVMDIVGPGDLGAILWVQHHPLLTNDGNATSFQDSILYTTEMDIPSCAEGTAADLVFLTFNMSHKEMFYARQCHSFLSGIILNCIQLGDQKPEVYNVAKLVSMYWTFQIPAGQFVDNLMLLKFHNGKKATRRRLLRWLQFSLPFARRYSKCISTLLQEGHQRSAACIALPALLS